MYKDGGQKYYSVKGPNRKSCSVSFHMDRVSISSISLFGTNMLDSHVSTGTSRWQLSRYLSDKVLLSFAWYKLRNHFRFTLPHFLPTNHHRDISFVSSVRRSVPSAFVCVIVALPAAVLVCSYMCPV